MGNEDQRNYESEEYYSDKKNLTQLKVKDLKAMAKQEGVSGYSKLKRNDVIRLYPIQSEVERENDQKNILFQYREI